MRYRCVIVSPSRIPLRKKGSTDAFGISQKIGSTVYPLIAHVGRGLHTNSTCRRQEIMSQEDVPSQPWPRRSQVDSQRRSQIRWSQTRSRWSIPAADLANIQQVIPPLPYGKRNKRKTWRFLIAFFSLAVVAFTSALDATSLSIALPV